MVGSGMGSDSECLCWYFDDFLFWTLALCLCFSVGFVGDPLNDSCCSPFLFGSLKSFPLSAAWHRPATRRASHLHRRFRKWSSRELRVFCFLVLCFAAIGKSQALLEFKRWVDWKSGSSCTRWWADQDRCTAARHSSTSPHHLALFGSWLVCRGSFSWFAQQVSRESSGLLSFLEESSAYSWTHLSSFICLSLFVRCRWSQNCTSILVSVIRKGIVLAEVNAYYL